MAATALGVCVVVLTMVFRRWRHLAVFLGSLFFTEVAAQLIYFGLTRPRPPSAKSIARARWRRSMSVGMVMAYAAQDRRSG